MGSDRPNVLMIVTDNQSADSLGCYGNVEHETPHTDRMAREGTLFLRAFCTSATCSPTRASILTGLMPSQHGVHLALPDNLPQADDYDVTREFRTLPATLAARGWQTGMVGKWHLGNPRRPGHGFEHWVAFAKGHTTDFYDNVVLREGREHRVRGTHIVDHLTDEAVAFLRDRDRRRPFFLQVNYDGPYVLPPTVVGPDPRNRFYQRFAGRTFRPFPPVDPAIIASLILPFDFDLDPAEEYTLESAVNNAWWTVRMHNDQATRANIAAQNALVDDGVGRILAALDEEGLAGDTLVLLTTDQGNPYGQRGLWGHPVWTDPPFMHDVTFRVPLIVRQPGTVTANRVTDTMVSHVDLFPTILDRLGIDDVEVGSSPGRSFAPLLVGEPLPGWAEEVYFEAETARTVRTPTHRFTKQLDGTGPDELFDLVADPEQWDNVAGRPEHEAVVGELGGRIDRFWDRYADPRYDLWRGGTAQAMVSRYLVFKGRYGEGWDVTTELGPRFTEAPGGG
ncbi:MAG: sulfatase-like hydrolase/transferase [Acidimicrobiia bacterium]|nr:sulfatase-like hydrolase/transferase [Acidimicrobiia bacterium]